MYEKILVSLFDYGIRYTYRVCQQSLTDNINAASVDQRTCF